jgi:enamine deaminase RidA (YjgF/YER057c/UK114 family)
MLRIIGLISLVVVHVGAGCAPVAPEEEEQAVENRSAVRFINPPTMATPPGFTHVVDTRGGRTIYIAGQVALDEAGNLVGAGDIGAQADQVFKNLEKALQAVGGSFDNVVKFNIFVADFSERDALRAVRDRYINTEQPPASTAVAVKSLFREEFLIEIDAIAVIPD